MFCGMAGTQDFGGMVPWLNLRQSSENHKRFSGETKLTSQYI